MDNVPQGAPIIPAGTANTVFGTKSFTQEVGQAPNTPNSGQSVESPQAIPQTPSPETSEYEKLVAVKGFASPDDLAKAYVNLESQNKRVEMNLAELVKIRNEANPEPVIVPPAVQTQEDAVRVVENLIKKQVRPLEDKLALQDLFFKNPDATQFITEMADQVKVNPGITWEAAYKLSKFDALQNQAKEEGKKEAYQTIQQKQSALVGGATKAAPKEDSNLANIIGDRSVPFQEVTRLMRERFTQ